MREESFSAPVEQAASSINAWVSTDWFEFAASVGQSEVGSATETMAYYSAEWAEYEPSPTSSQHDRLPVDDISSDPQIASIDDWYF